MTTIMHTREELQRDAYLWGGGRGWGKVTVDLKGEPKTTKEMIESAGLDWEVELHPMEAVIDFEGQKVRKEVPKRCAVVRSDNLAIVGDVGEGFKPLQNDTAFDFVDDILGSGEAHWRTAGETQGGARVHALLEVDKDIRIAGMDDERLIPLLMFRNGHDGGLSVTISVAPFRVACLNGMTVPIKGAMRQWKARHTKNVTTKMLEARKTLELAFTYFAGLEKLGNELVTQSFSDAEFDKFLEDLVKMPPRVGDEKDDRKFTNVTLKREGIAAVYKNTDNLNNIRGTKWGVLNAVAEYEDWQSRTRRVRGRDENELRFERATSTSKLKDRALELLTV